MTLTREEIGNRNLELIKKRLLYVATHPEDGHHPLSGTYVIELPRDDPELLEANLQVAVDLARRMGSGEEARPIVLMPAIEGDD